MPSVQCAKAPSVLPDVLTSDKTELTIWTTSKRRHSSISAAFIRIAAIAGIVLTVGFHENIYDRR